MKSFTQTCSRRAAVVVAVVGLAQLSCWRPSEPRVRRDALIGTAASDGITVRVENGHALIRQLGETELSLWASAPRLQLTLELTQPVERFSILVANCMAASVMEADADELRVATLSRGSRGECRYELSAPAGQWAIQIAPPDSEREQPFRFAVLSDVQEAVVDVQDIFQLMNEQPGLEFLLGAGDLTQRGTAEQLTLFQSEMRSLNIPYYTTLGNHELGQSPSLFHDFFGRGNSSFEYRGVRFTLLDSASATLDPVVYDWLDDWLKLGADSPHIVAMHIPPLDPVGVRNGAFASRAEAAKLLKRLAEGNVDMTVYGHIHSYYHFDNAGIPAHISGGGGAIPERFDNIGRHFLVVNAFPETQQFDVEVVRVD